MMISCYKAKKFHTLRNWPNFYMYFKFCLNTTGLSQSHFRNLSACSIKWEILLKNMYPAFIIKSVLFSG